MFKCLFPLIFVAATSAAYAQPQAPSGPLYDPQGRLIPYDPPPPDAGETTRPASKPKAAGKKSRSKVAESKSAPVKTSNSKKSGKTSKAQMSGKAKKSATKSKSSGKKPTT